MGEGGRGDMRKKEKREKEKLEGIISRASIERIPLGYRSVTQ